MTNQSSVISYPSLPGPHDIHREVFSNGITVLTRSNFNSPSVVVSGFLSAGSLLDPIDKLGLAHFTSVALMRGTKNSDFQKIFERLESVGASLGFGASVHNTSFSGRALAEDLPLLVETLKECILEPIFPIQYFDRLKSQLLTALAIRAQDTGDMASLTFDKLLFPGHPYGFPEDGHPESISAISREDLINFHEKNYGPQKMVVVVVGGIKPEIVFDSFEAALGNWQNSEIKTQPELPGINPPSKTVKEHINLEGKSQVDLVMGTLGPKRKASEFLAASLGNNILGQFGMMGRIGDVVREKAGLAYYASTSVNSWVDSGSWEVSAGVNPKNLIKATKLIINELERFCTEMVSQSELEDSQANYIGRLPLSLESNSGVANAILNIERFDLGLDYYQRYPSLINSVTREQILAVAQKYIDPKKLVIVSAGSLPGKGKKK
jgi:zinc protease